MRLMRRTLFLLAALFVLCAPLALAQEGGSPVPLSEFQGPAAADPVPPLAPSNPLPLAPVIGLLSSGLIWVATWVAKKVNPNLDAAKVAPWIGVVLGAALAILTYLTGVFPSATWVQTAALIVTSLSGGISGGIGAGILDRRFVKPVMKGEPTIETKVAVIETTPNIRVAAKV